jgi:hypothetical protein
MITKIPPQYFKVTIGEKHCSQLIEVAVKKLNMLI